MLALVAVDLAQLDVGIGEVRIHLHRFFQLLDGSVILPRIGQDLAEVGLVLQIQGIEFDGAPQMGQGFRVTRLPRQEEPVPVMAVRKIGIEFKGPLEFGFRGGKIEQAPE